MRQVVTAENLSDAMEFDRVIQVHEDGSVTDDNNLYAPNLYDDQLDGAGWTLMNGYSGQDRYRGPIMHNSEFIGGRMAEDILARPGFYVAIAAYWSPKPEDGDDPNENVIEGWAIAYREETPMTATNNIVEDLTVTLHGGARTVVQNVRRMYDTAYMWVQDPANWADLYDVGTPEDFTAGRTQAQMHKLQARLAEMRSSFYENFVDVITMDRAEAHFYWDSERSLTWQSGGLFGGLIFHADWVKDRYLPIGTWTLHT